MTLNALDLERTKCTTLMLLDGRILWSTLLCCSISELELLHNSSLHRHNMLPTRTNNLPYTRRVLFYYHCQSSVVWLECAVLCVSVLHVCCVWWVGLCVRWVMSWPDGRWYAVCVPSTCFPRSCTHQLCCGVLFRAFFLHLWYVFLSFNVCVHVSPTFLCNCSLINNHRVPWG